jgi:lipoprotein-releasing system ATP-binding protein
MNNSPILHAAQITKVFEEGPIRTEVLRGIDLQLYPGDQVAILGSSGSGKSTLLTILGGLALATSGKVEFNGRDLSCMSDDERSKMRNQDIGFVYQFHHLLPEFSSIENVAMPLLLRGMSKQTAHEHAQILLEKVNLSHRLTHRITELSGGERQRVAIARALVTKPKLLLADEPTGNLDHQTAEHVYELLLSLNANHNTTLVIVTHDLKLAERLPKRLVMVDGRFAI